MGGSSPSWRMFALATENLWRKGETVWNEGKEEEKEVAERDWLGVKKKRQETDGS